MKYLNMLDYVKENMNTFEKEAMNTLDVLVLTWLSYINYPEEEKDVHNYEGVPIRDLLKAEYFDEMFQEAVLPEKSKDLFLQVCFSRRFRNIKISNFINMIDGKNNIQFSAITIQINPSLFLVVYRGTDSSFVGWKEDFLLSLDKPIPSEVLGQRYLEDVLKQYDGNVIVSGHSKGGTIATYSACMNYDLLQNRLVHVYSFDGPGFRKEVLELPQFKGLRNKMVKLIPQGSLIGVLFNHECDVDIIYSQESGFWQHDPFSWEIVNHDFIYKEEVSSQSKLVSTSLSELADRVKDEDKIIVFDAIFDILQNSGATSFIGFTKVIRENLPYFMDSIKGLDKETVKLIGSTINNLAAISFGNIPETILKKGE